MEGGDVLDERVGNKRRERDEEEEDIRMGRLEKRPSGIVVMEEYSYSGDEMINGVKYEEEKETASGGGLFNQLITKLVSSPKSNQKVETDEAHNGNHGGSGSTSTENGGGVFKNLISNMFTTSNGGGEVVEEKDGSEVVEPKGEKDDGGSIIDNIVAQLPRTLSEDTAPATDEASILIHSIIHD